METCKNCDSENLILDKLDFNIKECDITVKIEQWHCLFCGLKFITERQRSQNYKLISSIKSRLCK